MKATKQLSHLQIDIMRTLWRRGEATVSDVHSDLQQDRGLAPTTVATMLSRLEKDGIVRHRSQGRQYVYTPRVTESEVRHSAVSELAERLFQGDFGALVNHLLKESDIEPGDLEEVREILESKEEEDASSNP